MATLLRESELLDCSSGSGHWGLEEGAALPFIVRKAVPMAAAGPLCLLSGGHGLGSSCSHSIAGSESGQLWTSVGFVLGL